MAWIWSRRALRSVRASSSGVGGGIKAQVIGLRAEEGEHARVDWIVLCDKAKIFGEVPGRESRGALWAAISSSTQISEQLPLAPLVASQTTRRGPRFKLALRRICALSSLRISLRFVRDALALVARQDMDGTAFLANVERDDVVECLLSRVHSYRAISCSWIVCGRQRTFLPFGWTRNRSGAGQRDNAGLCSLSGIRPRAAPEGGWPPSLRG